MPVKINSPLSQAFYFVEMGIARESKCCQPQHFALGTSSTVLSADKTCLRCSIPHESQAVGFLHPHDKNPEKGFLCGDGGNRTPV